MKTIRKLFWILGLALLTTLFVSGVVLAESEEPEPSTPAENAQAPPEDVVITENLTQESLYIEPLSESEQEFPVELEEGEPVISTTADVDSGDATEDLQEEATPTLIEITDDVGSDISELLSEETIDITLNESGTTLKLTGVGDPYYYNGGVLYQFFSTPGVCSVMNCFDGLVNPINAAIEHFSLYGSSPNDGFIYVESAIYPDAVNIDGSQGYLSGLLGLKGLHCGEIYPTIKNKVTIANMTNGFTLEGFIITGGVTIKDSTGKIKVDKVTGALTLTNVSVKQVTSLGIVITNHSGNITLFNVKSKSNLGDGLFISNLAGGNVTITNSAFDHSTNGYGVEIFTNGIVNINGLSASNNADGGLVVTGFSNLTLRNAVLNNNGTDGGAYLQTTKAAPVKLENVYAFGNNLHTGIEVITAGSVNALNIQACGNTGGSSKGMRIDTRTGTGTVSLINGRFNDNGNIGLLIESARAITLTSVTAQGNGSTGVLLNNGFFGATGNITVNSPASAGTVGANNFSGNSGYGLEIYSRGMVTITNIFGFGNSNTGLNVENIDGTAGITINKNISGWTNEFLDNSGFGIWLNSNGVVQISDIQASGNDWQGLVVDYLSASVSITRGQFHENAYRGLTVNSRGTITLTDVSACNNGESGTYSGVLLGNTNGNIVIRSSSVSKLLPFSRNSKDGIEIITTGSITISNIIAEENAHNGVNLNNQWVNIVPGNVSIARSQFIGNKGYHGIFLETFGHVTLDSIIANENQQSGVQIYACDYDGLSNTCLNSARVTLRGTSNEFNRNKGDGLYIWTGGAITLMNFSANNNSLSGITLNHEYSAIHAPVTISAGKNIWNTTQNNLNGHGLLVYTTGNVNISRLDSQNNKSYGAWIVNEISDGVVNVVINTSVLNYNQGDAGLAIHSVGIVTLINTRVNSNAKSGLVINTEGAVRLNGVEAKENGATNGNYDGAYINNYNGSGGVTVTSTSTVPSIFNDNKRTGLFIKTRGLVNITNISAEQNGYLDTHNYHSGIFIDESAGVTIRNTNAKIPNSFSRNRHSGLYIRNAQGHVIISGAILLNNNPHHGAYIFNADASDPFNVTISGVMANANLKSGIIVHSRGQVNIRNLTVEFNGQGVYSANGLEIDNSYGYENVTITGNNQFNRNGDIGLYIGTNGTVNIAGVTAQENAGGGIYINSNGYGKTVLLKTIRVIGNGGNGIYVETHGNLTLNNVTSLMNQQDGIHAVMNGNYALLQGSIFAGNYGDGIDLYLGSGGTYTIINCMYFGNDADNNGHITLDQDLRVY